MHYAKHIHDARRSSAMATNNPLLDDLAGLMTGAMGAARSAGEEVKTATQSRVRAMIADMDLAGRDEVEALKALAVSALERVEALEARVEALEGK
jgi:BMFP domain-containing protein YqiC